MLHYARYAPACLLPFAFYRIHNYNLLINFFIISVMGAECIRFIGYFASAGQE